MSDAVIFWVFIVGVPLSVLVMLTIGLFNLIKSARKGSKTGPNARDELRAVRQQNQNLSNDIHNRMH